MILILLSHVLTFSSMQTRAEESSSVLAGKVERFRTGFQFTEGPAWDGKGSLYFSDVPAGIIYRIDAEGKLSKFADPSHHSNGLLAWGDFLFACEMDGSIAKYRWGDAASRQLLVGEYEGVRFNAPNDLVVDKQGGVYFTDPEFRAPKPWPQKVRSVYYLSADGKVRRVVDELPNPNGIILSPDESKLYVVPSSQSQVMRYEVTGPGQIDGGKAWANLRQPAGQKDSGGDGCTIDSEGFLYATTGLGVQVIKPDGTVTEVITLPEVPSNATFGGADGKTLFITARTSVYRVATHRTGHVFGPK
ncbi:SMP-30/gluconolactonase/LRE family protein [bacterium]|nr:SMP-30/gluconolactonase/LRE family protein [bacterium]